MALPRVSSNEPPPVEGGDLTLITTVAVDSLSASNQNNVIVEFGLPLRDGVLASNERIAVFAGETRLTTQEDGRATNLDNHIRLTHIAALLDDAALPALQSGKVLSVYKETGSRATGAAKTIAELLALDTDAQCTYTLNVLGTTYTADFRTAAAGATTWSGKGNAFAIPDFIHDGPLRKTFLCKMPFKTSGGTAHPQLYATFIASAFSVDNFATILRWNFSPRVTNGFFDTTNQTAAFMEATITTGIASPITWRDFPSRTIDMSFTKTPSDPSKPNVLDVLTPATVTPGLWNANDHGKGLRSSDGKYGLVTSISADGSLASTVGINATVPYNTFASGTGAVPTGCTLWGVTLQFGGSWWEPDIWHGGQPLYLVRHERDYVFNSRLIQNCAIPSSFIKNTTGSIANGGGSFGTNLLDLQGNNPLRFRGSFLGEQEHSLDNPDSRVVPDYQLYTLRRLDAGGKYIDPTSYRRLYETPLVFTNHNPWAILDDNTGLLVNPSTPGREAVVDDSIPARVINRMFSYQEASDSHSDDQTYLPYVLSSKFGWLVGNHENAIRTYLVKGRISGQGGTQADNQGLNRFCLYNGAFRGSVWSTRIIAHAAFITPDDLPATITGLSKEHFLTWYANNGTQAKNRYVDDGSGHNGWSKETNKGPDYLGPGSPIFFPEQYGFPAVQCTILNFYFYYAPMLYGHLEEIGMLDTNWDTFFDAIVGCITESLVDPAILNVDETFGIYHVQNFPTGPSATFPLTWADLYTPYLVPAVTNWSGLIGYKGYVWEGLVYALEKGWYDRDRVRAALDAIIPLMDSHDVGTTGFDTDGGMLFVPSINSVAALLGRWVVARTD